MLVLLWLAGQFTKEAVDNLSVCLSVTICRYKLCPDYDASIDISCNSV